MPKASADVDRHPLTREHNVHRSAEPLQRPLMQAISEPTPVQRTAELDFGLRMPLTLRAKPRAYRGG